LANGDGMSTLSDSLDDYLRLRRSLGYKLERSGQVLADFVAFSQNAGTDLIRTDVAVSWALGSPNPDSAWRAGRLGMVRGFARYVHALDPRHEVPPPRLIPRGVGRRSPWIFTNDQVTGLMSAARHLRSPLQAATLETVVGLLWTTGLRVGEVVRLNNNDLDKTTGIVTVQDSKNRRSRIVPIDPSTTEALDTYIETRDRLRPETLDNSLFVSTVGRRVRTGNLGVAFASLVALAGLPPYHDGVGPRIGGLRHSFAVQTLIEWHNANLDVGALMPRLSTFMGHVNPASTYWYLSASPELLAAAAARLDHGGR
jgi:integrase/recombinase XerD